MTGPFIFIATNRLKQGKLNDEQKRVPDLIDFKRTVKLPLRLAHRAG